MEELLTPTAVALGKFDGVHLGHQRVIQPVLQPSKGENLPQQRIYSTVVTFHPHPQEFFTGQLRALLTPLDEKVQHLRSLGVEQLVLLPFDRELSALSPQEFVEKILVQKLQCQKISVGQDFCFGKDRTGTAGELQLLAAKYNIPVTIVPLQTYPNNLPTEYKCGSTTAQDNRISTSLIRQTLEGGDIQRANLLLGRPYTFTGLVIQGQQLGRTIGFPTANLQLPKDKFLPHQGVYAVLISILSEVSDTSAQYLGVMNIGYRPTVDGSHSSVEVHLLDWSGNLYGQKLIVQLVEFLRPEQKFPSIEALRTQIQFDCTQARKVLRVR
jgi:riboflavin kinase/FMN adenylyltransferase